MNVRDYTPPERHAEPADVARRLRAGGAVTTFRTERRPRTAAASPSG